MTPPSSPCHRDAGVLTTPAFAAFALALALILSSCRADLIGPARRLPFSVEPVTREARLRTADGVVVDDLPAIPPMVPMIDHLTADIRCDTLFIRGQLRIRDRHYAPFYDPSRVGGWSLQVFLDTDQRNPGYWLGYDYVVRGVEWSSQASTFVVRQITLDPGTPGGWGPEVGQSAFTQEMRSFDVAVPLESVGGVESDVNYCVETYATIPCPECSDGLTQEWSNDYFATLRDWRSHEASGTTPGGPGMAVMLAPVGGHAADASAHIARSTPNDR